MKYALNLGEGGRVLSATFQGFAVQEMPVADTLPDGDISDYIFADGGFVYDPLPKPESETEPPESQYVTWEGLSKFLKEAGIWK